MTEHLNESDLARQIRGHMTGRLGLDLGASTDQESLLAAGILDSLTVFKLVALIQETYGLSVADDELLPENFDSVEAIASFVSRRLNADGR